jgi:hypothetical protein
VYLSKEVLCGGIGWRTPPASQKVDMDPDLISETNLCRYQRLDSIILHPENIGNKK